MEPSKVERDSTMCEASAYITDLSDRDTCICTNLDETITHASAILRGTCQKYNVVNVGIVKAFNAST